MKTIYRTWLSAAVVLATALYVLAAGLAQPRHNFDMVGYVAAAHARDGARGLELWQRTFGDVRKETGPQGFETLISSSYRAAVHASPRSLEQHLPFYAIRVAYVEAMRLLNRAAGLSYPQASYMFSAACAALAVLVLGVVLARLGVPVAVLPVVVLLGGLVDLARFSTPDALACLGALSLVLLLLQRSPLVFVLAALMPLLRTDFVLLSVVVLGLAFFLRLSRPRALLSLLAAVAVYAWVNQSSGNYGYLTIFNFTLIARHPFPAEMPISTDLADYLRAYSEGLRAFLSSSHALVYAAVAGLFALKARQGRLGADDQALVVPALLFVAGHVALFPANLQRFYVFAICLALVWLAREAWALLQARVPVRGAAG